MTSLGDVKDVVIIGGVAYLAWKFLSHNNPVSPQEEAAQATMLGTGFKSSLNLNTTNIKIPGGVFQISPRERSDLSRAEQDALIRGNFLRNRRTGEVTPLNFWNAAKLAINPIQAIRSVI